MFGMINNQHMEPINFVTISKLYHMMVKQTGRQRVLLFTLQLDTRHLLFIYITTYLFGFSDLYAMFDAYCDCLCKLWK